MNDPEYIAVDVVNASDKLVTVVAIFNEANTIEFEFKVQVAPFTAALFKVIVQAVTLLRVKAEGKAKVISKSVENVLVGLSCIWYCELVDLAELGVAVVEVIVKLTL